MMFLNLLAVFYYSLVSILFPIIFIFVLWEILTMLNAIYKIVKQIVDDINSVSKSSHTYNEPLDMTDNIISRRRLRRIRKNGYRSRSKTL